MWITHCPRRWSAWNASLGFRVRSLHAAACIRLGHCDNLICDVGEYLAPVRKVTLHHIVGRPARVFVSDDAGPVRRHRHAGEWAVEAPELSQLGAVVSVPDPRRAVLR